MISKNVYFLIGQISLVAGLLLFIFFNSGGPVPFISGCLVGISFAFNIAYYYGLKKGGQ